MILSVDLGGTNARFALYENIEESFRLKEIKVYSSNEFTNLSELLNKFKSEYPSQIESCCFAVPGPVKNQKEDKIVNITNLPWQVKLSELKEYLQTKKISLVNDVVAAASSIALLEQGEIHSVYQTNETASETPTAVVLSLGTGVGQALYLEHGNGSFTSLPSEGGHCSLSTHTAKQRKVSQFLTSKYGHSSVEQVISGTGLENIYESITGERLEGSEISSLARSEKVTSDREVSAVKTIELFQEFLGQTLANIALSYLPSKGIYLAGGVSNKLKTEISSGKVTESYLSHGRLRDIREGIPLKLINTENAGLTGAAAFAKQLLRN